MDLFEHEEGTDLTSSIRKNYTFFSAVEKKIADYLLLHYDEIPSMSITTLAQRIKTSPTAITRFCQALHYKGYSEFKFYMSNQLLSPPGTQKMVEQEDSINGIRQKLTKMDIESIYDSMIHLDTMKLQLATQAICEASKVYVYADGGPACSGEFACQLFWQIGINCQFFSDIHFAMLSVTHLKPGDVVIDICRSGEPTTTMPALLMAKDHGVTIIGITSNIDSSMAKICHILLPYTFRIESDLRYLHIARMCEIAIIGLLQSAVINALPDEKKASVSEARDALYFCSNAVIKGTGVKNLKST